MKNISLLIVILLSANAFAQQKRPRDLGISIGVMSPGKLNAITDVTGVQVGHVTIIKGDSVRTGVTAILPHNGNIFQQKVPAAIFIGNGFGKLTGISQVKELGNIETPIILTNTVSVADAAAAVISYTLHQTGNERVRSVNAVIGETNDGGLNDIRGRHVKEADVIAAIKKVGSGIVVEGAVGAGTGTVCFGYKGGIGTSSRKLPASLGGYTVGVIVQTNFGGVLQIDGVPVGEELNNYYLRNDLNKKEDGSCMIVVATDAPLDSRNLERLAKRAFMGLAKTGGIAHNGSGDYVIAFTTDSTLRVPYNTSDRTQTITLLNNDAVSPLFMAAIEATEEAIINSLFAAGSAESKFGKVEALPVDKVINIMKKYNRINAR
jgi:D-aminopeptidase